MLKSLLLLSVSLCLANCAGKISLPDVSPCISLPASGDGYCISTVTQEKRRTDRDIWAVEIKRAIILTPPEWAKLKKWISKQCLMNQCEQAIGTLDGLFYAIDNGLKKVGY